MNNRGDKVIGIVGGMGPQAGITLFNEIVAHTQAATDQQHFSVILMSFPGAIVDRTGFLEGNTRINPAFGIVDVIRKLDNAGAEVIGIACNTSYSPRIYNVVLSELEKAGSRLRLLDMPFETCDYIRKQAPQARRIGLMTTNGTYRTGIYSNLLQSWGYEVIVPDIGFQTDVIHKMIYDREFGIKSNPLKVTNEVRILLDKALQYFEDKNTDVLILGCTDLSFLFTEKKIRNMLIVDSTSTLAKALIREAVRHTYA